MFSLGQFNRPPRAVILFNRQEDALFGDGALRALLDQPAALESVGAARKTNSNAHVSWREVGGIGFCGLDRPECQRRVGGGWGLDDWWAGRRDCLEPRYRSVYAGHGVRRH